MKNIVLLLVVLLAYVPVSAQHEADNWLFGQGAGISFQSGSPKPISCKMFTQEGCASISDKITGTTSTHQSVGKESGQTAHVERWNNTLRQRISRFVRKTLSFSKCDTMHKLYLHLFIYYYNLSLIK